MDTQRDRRHTNHGAPHPRPPPPPAASNNPSQNTTKHPTAATATRNRRSGQRQLPGRVTPRNGSLIAITTKSGYPDPVDVAAWMIVDKPGWRVSNRGFYGQV